MNATINFPTESLLVDQPNVVIPSTMPGSIHDSQTTSHSTRSFADMHGGKFRRLFNRHTPAFRR